MTRTVEKLFKVENILLPRAAFLQGAKRYNLFFFFDASDDITKTSVLVQNEFENRQVNRILMNKIKLCDSSMGTTPRKELGAAHLCSRVKEIVCYHLGAFLDQLGVPWSIAVLSDSTIVLSQIASLPYFYKPYVAARLAEIQELLPSSDPQIQFKHVRSEGNIADIGTRVSFPEPEEIPWLAGEGDIELKTELISDPLCLNVSHLPDTKKNEISFQNMSNYFCFPPITVTQLVSVQLPLEPKQEEEKVKHPAFQMVDNLLKRKSLSFAINVLARIMKWRNPDIGFSDCQNKMRQLIFVIYQLENMAYVKSFGGHLFSKIVPKSVDEPTFLQCRQNVMGPSKLLLVPKKTRLFEKIVQQFHNETGHASDEYIRMWLIRHGIYLPNALNALAKFRRSCIHCRKKAEKRVILEMGHVGRRQQARVFCESLSSDFAGPFLMSNPVNKRATRKYWLMVCICNMSRFITITMVESLSKTSILKSIQQHKFRFGETKEIFSDKGTNYTAAQRTFQQNNEDVLSSDVMDDVQRELKSAGTEIITRVGRAPWIQGSQERAIGVVKKLWPTRKLEFSEIVYLIEKVMFMVNSRPLSMSNAGLALCPNDLRPLVGDTLLGEKENNFLDAYENLRETIKRFEDNWNVTYQVSITKMKKWLKDSIKLQKGDLVLCSDIQAPKKTLCLVEKVLKDTSGRERYFQLSYTLNGKRKTVQRAGNNLVFLQSKEERESGRVRDSLSFLPKDDNFLATAPKLKVKYQTSAPMMEDI